MLKLIEQDRVLVTVLVERVQMMLESHDFSAQPYPNQRALAVSFRAQAILLYFTGGNALRRQVDILCKQFQRQQKIHFYNPLSEMAKAHRDPVQGTNC